MYISLAFGMCTNLKNVLNMRYPVTNSYRALDKQFVNTVERLRECCQLHTDTLNPQLMILSTMFKDSIVIMILITL
jgi:hypothetical protein